MYNQAQVAFTCGAVDRATVEVYRCPQRRAAPGTEESMAVTPQTATQPPEPGTSTLQELAKRHLWMHFSRMGAYEDAEIPILVRGEGSYVWDEHGNRYLDGLSALFCVNAGHGRAELGQAAATQAEELAFYTNWSYAHPRCIELAARIAALTPDGLNRVFFTSGGSEAVESAWKLVRNYHKQRGEAARTKLIAREIAYHGTSLGALAATGITDLRTPFEPLTPGGCHVPNTNSYRWPAERDPLWAAEAIEERILFEGPETVGAVILEPVQNAGGCFPPQDGYFQRVREICDRYGVLLISDEVICSWGRLGWYFGCDRYDYRPDLITTAKGLTSAYAPMGALIVSDEIAEPFMHGKEMFTHGFTFGGHPVAAAVALANLDIFEREDLSGHVRAKEPEFRQMLEGLRDIPIVGDVRGAGFFQAIELVKDRETKESFDDDESEELLRGFLSGELYRRGLICRADDRGDPVIQLAPPLVADTEQFEEIGTVLRSVLSEAWEQVVRH
jgi:adenosylmethionine-8-amino-7-oxononanoate aminotransferase